MADQADRSERTEEATPKKIEDALKKGQTPFSRETPTFASLLGLLVIFGIVGRVARDEDEEGTGFSQTPRCGLQGVRPCVAPDGRRCNAP